MAVLKKWLWTWLLAPLLLAGCATGGGQGPGTETGQEQGQTTQTTQTAQAQTVKKPPAYQGKVPILMYHHLVPKRFNNPDNPAIVTVEDFRAQLDYLKEAGYTTVSLAEYLAYLDGNGDLPAKPVLITFDDGYASNYYYAWPLLQERGMKAAIFVVANWIAYEDPPDDPRKMEMASWNQLRKMLESGVFEVQSHTFDSHYRIGDGYALTRPKPKADGAVESREEFVSRVRKDLADAKKTIEAMTGYPVFAIAFPWGGYTDETLLMAKEAGYTLGVTSKQGINEPGAYPLTLMRRGIINGDSLERFKEKLQGK